MNGFVSGHSAVAAALATAAAPYLSRRLRRVAWALALTVGLARVYVGAHLPLDVVGGLLVGWVTGSLVHHALGVPRWEPAASHVADLLDRFGLPAAELRPAGVPARSSHPFVATGPGGRPLFVKVLDPDPLDRDWLYRGARLLVVGDVKDFGALAPLGRQAADEAVAAMTARERGVRVPAVLLARGTDGRALVVQERVDGRSLQELPPEELTGALLRGVWAQVAQLGEAHVAHRDLVAANVLDDATGDAWIVDFGDAETGADDDAVARDVAELMTSLALRTDPRLVVDTAVDGLGEDVVTRALPGLEPLALSAATRAGLRAHPGRLSDLRRATRARLGLPDTERPRLPPRGRPRLAGRPGRRGHRLRRAGVDRRDDRRARRGEGRGLALAGCRAGGCRRRPQPRGGRDPVRRGPAAGGRPHVRGGPGRRRGFARARADRGRIDAGRYFERSGVLPDAAGRAYDRIRLGTTLGAAVVAAAAAALPLYDGRLTSWRMPPSLLALGVVGLAAFLLVSLGQALARRRGPAVPRSWGRPELGGIGVRRIWSVVAWSGAGIALETAGLAAALQGVGGHVPVPVTAAVYTVLRLCWTALPVAGAPGIGEASLVLALTASGELLGIACAGVLVFRLLFFWPRRSSGRWSRLASRSVSSSKPACPARLSGPPPRVPVPVHRRPRRPTSACRSAWWPCA